ncbi:hypothetical protein DFO54_111159 [Erwinia sp. AG740]|nr:hypothetical protein DFO54_111159 [Erwinia sp. AG740]
MKKFSLLPITLLAFAVITTLARPRKYVLILLAVSSGYLIKKTSGILNSIYSVIFENWDSINFAEVSLKEWIFLFYLVATLSLLIKSCTETLYYSVYQCKRLYGMYPYPSNLFKSSR